jgi:GNAT superfamily N-acetyltransferase
MLKVVYALRERGWIQGTGWVLQRFGQYVRPRVYQSVQRVLLECSLDRAIAPHTPSIDLEIREATEADAPALSSFFAAFGRRMDAGVLRRRLHNGYLCYLGLHGRDIVGMNWIATAGDECAFTGLRFRMMPGSCYGFELYEHPHFTGKGVGMALLVHGLIESKARGFKKQVSWVDVSNTKMLSASIHMLDFVKVGTIRTTRLFRRPFSRWEFAGRSGHGGSIVM